MDPEPDSSPPEVPCALTAPPARLTSRQQAMAERYMPLARRLSQSFKRADNSHWHEYDSAAFWALSQAARKFQTGRGITFASYASYLIRGELINTWRKLAKDLRRESDPLPPNNLLLGSDAPIGSDLESRDEVESYLRKLPPKHAEFCRRIYQDGATQAEAGRAMKLSKMQTFYLHCQSMMYLRNETLAYRKHKDLAK